MLLVARLQSGAVGSLGAATQQRAELGEVRAALKVSDEARLVLEERLTGSEAESAL